MEMTRAEFIAFWSFARDPKFATADGWVKPGYMPRMAVPCDGECGFEDCKGWIMTSAEPDDAAFYAVQHPEFQDWIPDTVKRDPLFAKGLEDWRPRP